MASDEILNRLEWKEQNWDGTAIGRARVEMEHEFLRRMAVSKPLTIAEYLMARQDLSVEIVKLYHPSIAVLASVRRHQADQAVKLIGKHWELMHQPCVRIEDSTLSKLSEHFSDHGDTQREFYHAANGECLYANYDNGGDYPTYSVVKGRTEETARREQADADAEFERWKQGLHQEQAGVPAPLGG